MRLALFVCLFIAAGCASNEKKMMNDETTSNSSNSGAPKPMVENATDEMKKDMGDMMASKASCILDKDTRVIEVKKTEGGGCELFYTKFGEAKSVASSGFGTQYCEEVKDRIQTNLNKAGFACQ